MKKAVLFLGLLGGLASCDKLFDDTPKCDDKEVIQLVEELGVPKNDYWVNIYNDYYDETLRLNTNGYYNEWSTKLFEQLTKENYQYLKNKYGTSSHFDIEDEKTRKNFIEESSELRDKRKEKAYKEITENMDYIKNNYQTDATLKAIYDGYYSTKISNIRPVSSDKENKKCECEATLNLGSSLTNNEKEIHYTAQKNTDGQIYVELWNF